MHTQRHVLGTTTFAILFSAAIVFAQAPDEEPVEHVESESKPADTSWRRPLASRNQFPVSLLFVSLAPDKASSLANGRVALDIKFDYSNIISGQESEDEIFYLDLEYLRTEVELKRGLPKQMELGVSIPFYIYYGGFLDPFVSGFHELLGLPNFLRGMTENGQTRYELVTRGGAPFLGDESLTAVGDVTVHFKKTLFEKDLYAVAVRSDLKLPTGNPEKLSGSGATDLGIGAAFDRITDRWAFYTNANFQFLGQPDELRVKNFFSFMVGFDLRLKPRMTAHLQFDHARPFVESELGIFNEGAQQLALGLRWRYSDRFVYEWRFVEDLSDASTDFTFSFQIGVRWDRKSATP